jgi:protein gp37
MKHTSIIEWSDTSWNAVTGCTKFSQGCKNCYAEKQAAWLNRMGQSKYSENFKVRLHEDAIEKFYQAAKGWRETKLVFVNSMSDQFHPDVPVEFTQKMFSVMGRLPNHRFKILTKRSARLVELSPFLEWHENIIVGVSIEHADYISRLADLKKVPAAWRSLSLEPLLGPLPNLDLDGIDWVVCGGESGNNARPIDPEWVRDIRDQCLIADVPFTFKQWGGSKRRAHGNELDGHVWGECPLEFMKLSGGLK